MDPCSTSRRSVRRRRDGHSHPHPGRPRLLRAVPRSVSLRRTDRCSTSRRSVRHQRPRQRLSRTRRPPTNRRMSRRQTKRRRLEHPLPGHRLPNRRQTSRRQARPRRRSEPQHPPSQGRANRPRQPDHRLPHRRRAVLRPREVHRRANLPRQPDQHLADRRRRADHRPLADHLLAGHRRVGRRQVGRRRVNPRRSEHRSHRAPPRRRSLPRSPVGSIPRRRHCDRALRSRRRTVATHCRRRTHRSNPASGVPASSSRSPSAVWSCSP